MRTVSLQNRRVQVTFELEPNAECPLAEVQTDLQKVIVNRSGDECRCDFVLTEEVDGELLTLVGQTSRNVECCANTVLNEFDCVPEVVEVNESHIVIQTFVDESTDICDLLEELNKVCTSAKIKRVTTNFDGRLAQCVKDVDLSDITQAQREAIEFAIEEGYYARPRQISLREMADEFDISEQAFAQRLARAEEKVMDQVFC